MDSPKNSKKAGRRVIPKVSLSSEIHLLLTSLFLLLIPDIRPDHAFVKPNRNNTVSLGPEMVTPVWLPLQIGETPKSTDSRSSFHRPHQRRDRYFGTHTM